MSINSAVGLHSRRTSALTANYPTYASLLLSLSCCLWLIGCKQSATWSADSRSPDQKLIVKAETVENGGFGTGWVQTAVFLNWTTGSQKPKLILSFTDGPSGPGGMKVQLNWLSNSNLELVYTGARAIDFEAVKCSGVDITVRDSLVRVP